MIQRRWIMVGRSCKQRLLGVLLFPMHYGWHRVCSARLMLAVMFVLVLSFLLRRSSKCFYSLPSKRITELSRSPVFLALFQVSEINFRQYKYVFSTETILELRSSSLHNVTVAQSGRLRMLRFDMLGTEGVIHLDHPQLVLFKYMRLQLLCLLWNAEPERILILGLGAGILPRIFHHLSAKTRIDVVEIDRAVVELAEKYFSFSQTSVVRVHVEDGRHFLERQPSNQYDMILIDAFIVNGRIPHALRTLECLGEYRRLLKSTGLLAANFLYEQESRYRQTYARALFHHIYRVEAKENYILIGLHQQARIFNDKDFEIRARELERSKPLPEFSWLKESQNLRNGNEDRWNVSAKIFTDAVFEDS